MGRTGSLARNFPTVDEPNFFQNGCYTSFKTINLNDKTYQISKNLESAIENKALYPLQIWNGSLKPWAGERIDPASVREKVLHIGIPHRAMTEGQRKSFENIARKIQQYNAINPGRAPIKLRLEVIW
jgi:hypothetical protein